jgi:MipA family protein
MPFARRVMLLLAGLVSTVPALAETATVPEPAAERPARRIMLGTGIQITPSYPGASTTGAGFLPLFDSWKEGELLPVESPDEAFGFALAGKRGGLAAGPAMAIAATRPTDAVPGLAKVGFGLEAGGFVEAWPADHLRLRAELRHGIGAHKALLGDLAADLVWRSAAPGEAAVATIGPRLRWGSAKHNRAYFGVPAPNTGPGPAAGFTPYEPGAGLYAVGASAGLRLPLGKTFGLYTYAGYDRLTGPAADSPIVRMGSRDQVSAGAALTYRFSL